MPAPSSVVQVRPDLSGSLEEFGLAADRLGFIGRRVFPVFDVNIQAGKFGKIPIEQLLQARDTLRAPGAGYSRGSYTFTDDSYATEEHGAEEPIDDREAKIYGEYFDAEQVATERARDVVLRNQEIRICAIINSTALFTGAPLTTPIGGGLEWSVFTAGKPLTDIQAAAKKVWDNSGLKANAVVMSWKTFWNLRRCAEITDLVKYNGLMDVRTGEITPAAIAQMLDIPNVIIAGSAKNTANEMKTAVIASIFNDDHCMVCRIAQTQDLREPCIGRILHWNEDGSQPEGTVETYRDETIRGNVVRVRHDVDEKLLYLEMGHLITNTAA